MSAKIEFESLKHPVPSPRPREVEGTQIAKAPTLAGGCKEERVLVIFPNVARASCTPGLSNRGGVFSALPKPGD